jgi:hypothetical protein
MLAYIIRRLLYAMPILIGVNLITFALFFVVNSPDDMARMQLGAKRVTTEAIEKWKAERGYDKPLLWNAKESGAAAATETIFFRSRSGCLSSTSATPTTAATSPAKFAHAWCLRWWWRSRSSCWDCSRR